LDPNSKRARVSYHRWVSQDGKYWVGLQYGDVDAPKKLYAVLIETTDAHRLIENFVNQPAIERPLVEP
jgi:hypothetical protein